MSKTLHTLQNVANEVAERCGFVQRIRKLSGAAFIQTLVFGWLEAPDASYADLANTARALGIDISRQAIEQHMTPEAADALKATLEAAATQMLTLRTQNLPLLKKFTGVYVQDSTWITLLDELHTWNIYITNIDTDQFTAEQIISLVRIR
ncbi:hypothetical protein F4212_10585 [Candidatus Poribacteria bacterium]|nr:hypothetical protein [Candidatus Poribacteria bacterium]